MSNIPIPLNVCKFPFYLFPMRIFLAVLVWNACLPFGGLTQDLEGYHHQNDTSYFLFSETVYGQSQPEKVVLTGSFRNWSTDMDDEKWQLTKGANSLWTLAIYNPNFETISPRAEFKFRIGRGEWLSPPADAPNKRGGNLVFMNDMQVPTLTAELHRGGRIWVRLTGTHRSLSPQDYLLVDAFDRIIPIAEVLPNTDTETLLIPAEPIDIRRVYYLKYPQAQLKALCSFDGWFRDLYSTKELGANVENGQTWFRIFSPRAEGLKLYLYHESVGDEAYAVIDMTRDEDGVWEALVPQDLKGTYYDFTVHGPAHEPGSDYYESRPIHISDPYARVNMDAWGRSRVWYKTQPATPLSNGIPPMQDVIAYEVHVQDFTDLLPVADDLKGTLPAMYQRGLTNKKKEPIGFDYLVNLGINVVHLMPVQEFMHYPDDMWRESFAQDPFMQEMGIAEENYQWGYRTSHCFAVENKFRQRGTEPGTEREQFRDLVQAFHAEDIAVIIDIVPNHTAEDMDNEPHYFHFNVLGRQYYYRTRDLEHIGEYGNEVKTEDRPMTQRWLIDQVLHFRDEFGIDGIRIDLAGQIDQQTLHKLRQAVGPDFIIYGEPWIGSNDPNYENNPAWDWYKHNSPITFFQDETRDALIGNPFELEEKGRDRGYAGGNYHLKGKVKQALANQFGDDKTPISGINYLDIHDNWALADRFAIESWNGLKGVHEARYKIAGLLLYTSLGPIVTHGGVEIMRSKGMAPQEEFVKQGTDWLEVHFKGRDDTYNMRRANSFLWETVGMTDRSRGSKANYKSMFAFWQGLNEFRLSEYGAVFRQAEAVPESYYRWIETVNPYQLGYIVDERVMVLINIGGEFHDWDQVHLPAGNWKLIGSLEGIDHVNGISAPANLQHLQGGQPHDFRLTGPSFMMWVRE